MANEKTSVYQPARNLSNLTLNVDYNRIGLHELTITEYLTSVQPQIAAGSIIEVNGALYKFTSNETISTTDPDTSSTVADGTVYIRLEPTGSTIDITDGNTTASSAVVTMSSTTGLSAGMRIYAAGVPDGTTIQSVDSGTQITMDANATATQTGINMTFSNAALSAAFTATAPTWSDSKQGWYGTGGSATHRYLHYVMTKATTNYSNKANVPFANNQNVSIQSNGDILTDSNFIGGFNGELGELTDGTKLYMRKYTVAGGAVDESQLVNYVALVGGHVANGSSTIGMATATISGSKRIYFFDSSSGALIAAYGDIYYLSSS